MQPPRYTVGIYTLGCKVNQYESEAIAERIEELGHRVLPTPHDCDACIINTCTVTSESDRKVRQTVRRAMNQNPRAIILVTGCLAQTDPEHISAIPGVDYISGNSNKLHVADVALKLLSEGKKLSNPIIDRAAPDANGFEKMSIRRFDRTRAYIKIQDGCESHCTYCIIPTARGKIRSKDPESVLCEVRRLTELGCREVVLTGIETASYGKDLKTCDLAEILKRVSEIPNIGRVRLGSLDPSLIKQEFVDRIAPLAPLAPHFHLSMQSGSDGVLRRMKRKYNRQMALEAMQRLRAAMPDVQFTTDMIVGFPQETDEEFEETLDFVRQARFLMIHAFPYSKRAGTPAAEMDGQVPPAVKQERMRRLTDLQNEIQGEILSGFIGTEVSVLFETYERGSVYGHTPNFVEVVCPSDHAMPAETRTVRITGVCNGRCTGELLPILIPQRKD
jgi:threonylcarbamoyladenosine tRNA methylthiotransferase MtaB